ncbi:hypothetical protein MPNT_40016 [Candidatus Methylacidithermus pantelleriae]|uniref:Uncharacterized protein n=2 Tax=Candidatus Methylacidithermus pantelleriae TaxID=2744239 RepID=A0A8J2BP95_9BACT|nr:hypothetical protein MPNT_40016 [Candidatus Methylacidithermus pantelleriae]
MGRPWVCDLSDEVDDEQEALASGKPLELAQQNAQKMPVRRDAFGAGRLGIRERLL